MRESCGPRSKPNFWTEGLLADEARFIKSWFENPLLIGAVLPSGPALAQMMAGAIDPTALGPIIELGPGTGAITQALLDRGVEPGRLILVEFGERFCALLAERFPGLRIVRGDAYDLPATLADHLDSPAAAIVSSLPLMTKPGSTRLALLADAFDLMAPDGVFVQFTYGLASPIPRKGQPAGQALAFEAKAMPRIWPNLPPAQVWVYRRPGTGPRTARTEVRSLRQFEAGKKLCRRPKAAFDAAKLRMATFLRDLMRAPASTERRLQPLRVCSRKMPDRK
jgi:phosphatidylethanolamine/phosphatidyl-N-methylethanolamine N-methyltransferase